MSQTDIFRVILIEETLKKNVIMNMNQYLFSAILAALPLMACSNSGRSLYEEKGSVFVAGYADKSGRGDVTKTLNLRDFHGLRLEHNVDVSYTQGNTYKVTVSGDERTLAKTSVKVEDGLLVVRPVRRNNGSNSGNTGDIRLVVTAPVINSIKNYGICTISAGGMSVRGDMDISNSGNMTFKSEKLGCAVYDVSNYGILKYEGDLTVRKFNLNNSGSMTMAAGGLDSDGIVNLKNYGMLAFNVDGVSCAAFRSVNSGSFSHKGNVKAKGAIDIKNHGMYKSESDYDVSGVMTVGNSGSDEFTGSVKAREYRCTVYGQNKDRLDVKAQRLDLDISGSGNMKLVFKGDNVNMRCYGQGNIDMDLGCRRLEAVNSGSAVITLRGTADDIVLDGTGASKIDTSGLNRF